MMPFLALVLFTLLARTLGFLGVSYLDAWETSLRVGVCFLFLLAASAHWGKRRPDLIRMVPTRLPRPDWIVTVTGWLEILGALLILFPATASPTSILLAILLLAMFPANIRAARDKLTLGGKPATPLVLRTLFQIVFLSAVLMAGQS